MRKFFAVPVSRNKMLRVLDVVKIILFLLLIVMFVNFNKQVAQQSATTQRIAQSTNHVVKSQADILNAIKQVTDDTHTTAAQQTAIIICMLQVPVYQRTTDLQAQCRAQASDAAADNAARTAQGSTGTQIVPGPSSQPTPTNTPTQSNTSQPPTSSPSILDRLVRNPVKNIINAL